MIAGDRDCVVELAVELGGAGHREDLALSASDPEIAADDREILRGQGGGRSTARHLVAADLDDRLADHRFPLLAEAVVLFLDVFGGNRCDCHRFANRSESKP